MNETRLDALRDKIQKAAVIKRLRKILPQKTCQRQSLPRVLSAPARAGGTVPVDKPKAAVLPVPRTRSPFLYAAASKNRT
jgi:hypothetical protein